MVGRKNKFLPLKDNLIDKVWRRKTKEPEKHKQQPKPKEQTKTKPEQQKYQPQQWFGDCSVSYKLTHLFINTSFNHMIHSYGVDSVHLFKVKRIM